MKIRASIKKLCEGCNISQYNRRYYVRCKLNPRHKQRQKFSTIKDFEVSPSISFKMITPLESMKVERVVKLVVE